MKEMTIRAEKSLSAVSRAALKAAGAETERHKRPIPVRDICVQDGPRIDMRDGELNRVLGGGLVPGSLVLLGGEPGIGKSTLVLQTVLGLSDKKVLYVSGEESARQIKLRADRLCGEADVSEHLFVLCETSLEQIFLQI